MRCKLEYELGVMMFNAMRPEYANISDSYDIEENFIRIIGELEMTEDSYMVEGYIAEAIGYNIPEEQVKKMYNEDMRYIYWEN